MLIPIRGVGAVEIPDCSNGHMDYQGFYAGVLHYEFDHYYGVKKHASLIM